MGGGASAIGVSAAVRYAPESDLKAALDPEVRARLRAALSSLEAEESAATDAVPAPAAAASPKPAPVAAEAAVPAPSAAEPAAPAPEEAADDDTGDIPKAWGWPAEPFDAAVLRQWVLTGTADTAQDKWNAALEARTVAGSKEDHTAEKAFANLMLNKEGTGEEKEHKGIDPNAYKKGKWYRFLNAKGDCYVYVHNYTRDITATKPENFTDLSAEEKARLAKLGTFIKELPEKLIKVYDKQKQIPLVYASQETAEALKTFAEYDKDWQLLDVTPLKKVNPKSLEDSRIAIVNAMKYGKMLCVYLGDVIPDIQEKVCTTKNRDTFPFALWTYGSLDTDMVKEKIFRPEDKEGGQCPCRPGFRICVVLMYDNMCYEMSSMRKDELPGKIPNFHHMDIVRTYAEHDIGKLLSLADTQ